MKILFLEWDSFGNEDIIEAFEALGYTVIRVPFSNKNTSLSEKQEQELFKQIECHSPDFIFSFNYFPVISLVCRRADVKYVSWIYDSPYVMLYSYTTIHPCNYIFIFDQELYLEFHRAGITTIHYLPMAANTDRLSSMTDLLSFEKSCWKNETDIAFIGSMYTEKHQFYERLNDISPYTRGYLEGIMAAQLQVYGYNFIQELLTKEIIDDLKQALPMEPNKDGVETIEYLYAQYVINRKITSMERHKLISAIGKKYPIDLYTPDKSLVLPGAVNHGTVDYYGMAPYVYRNVKINLNISLRSIKSGMPLRIFDIMGSGGFLLTNFQSDFLDYFVPGEDFVYYEDKDDLLFKIGYYLEHGEERQTIASNGFEKIKAAHTYKHRAMKILSYL